MAFQLHPALQQDCVSLGDFQLCRLLLMRDANYHWLILVPKRDGISEQFQLDPLDQEQLIWESSFVAKRMMEHFQADKMNIAALGNVVPQLHIHHVARFRTDPAWPSPIWGRVPAKLYEPQQLQQKVVELQQLFSSSAFVPRVEK